MGMVFACRGLKLRETEFVYSDEGDYAVVFAARKTSRAWKVFKKRGDVDLNHCQQVFEGEIEAYQRAGKSPDLAPLVPTFFGVCQAPPIIDRDSVDVSSDFYRTLAFQTHFVNGTFCKFSIASDAEQKRIGNLFRTQGIHHFRDSSVLLVNGNVIKVIDFSMNEIELWHR